MSSASRKRRPEADTAPVPREGTRDRIIVEAARLLKEGGPTALTTRAVAVAARVQAPTLYRLFGDKDGLLEAVAEEELRRYVARKRGHVPKADALEDLRFGWDLNVEFGLEHPSVFTLLTSNPANGSLSRVAASGLDILRARIHHVAAAGLLRVSEERATALVRAAGTGTVLTLLSMPPAQRDAGLSVAAREAVIVAITSSRPAVKNEGAAGAAIALRASLHPGLPLSPGERQLLGELLDRLAG